MTDVLTPEEVAREAAVLPRPILVALDVDGTLAPILGDPTAARVPDETQDLLRALASHDDVCVALVTGRDASQLARMVRVPGAYRALSHGRLLVPPGETVRTPRERAKERAYLDAFAAWGRAHAVPKGARVEVKNGARAIHVRELAGRDPREARTVLNGARREARRLGLHARDGRHVIEAETEPGDKGEALASLLEETQCRSVIYAGDDLTDLPAIERAVSMGGVGIFVASPEQPAGPEEKTLAVEGPEGVKGFLEALVKAL